MRLIDHVSIAVLDIDAARPFYDAVMTALGCAKVYDRPDALGYGERCRSNAPDESYLAVYPAADVSPCDRRHWCFKASTRVMVDAFHRAGLASGGTCDGPPGIRAHYHPSYYAAFLRDPSGNRLEAVCHHEA